VGASEDYSAGDRPKKQGENTMTNMSGADAIVATLKAYQVEVAFGFIGHSTHQIAQAMSESGIPTVNPATELGGAYMAVAYNYLRNAPAAVGLWHTVGSLFIPPALQEATSSRIPSVHLGFNSDSRLSHRDGLQQVPAAMMESVTRFNARVERADKLPELIHRAFQTAQGIPAGAAYLDIPFDLTSDRATAVVPKGWKVPRARAAPHREQVREASQLIRSARRPVVLLGGGAVRSGAGKSIAELLDVLGIPFVTTTTAQGLLPDTHPLSLGTAGMAGWTSANDALKEADLLLVLGSRLADWGISQGFTVRLPRLIQVDTDPARLGEFYFPDLSIVADVDAFAAALVADLRSSTQGQSLDRGRWDEHVAICKKRKQDWLEFLSEAGKDDRFPVSPWRIMAELRAAMSEDDIIVSDIGNHSWWVLQGILVRKPRKILMSFGEGLLGSAVPMGIGAKLAQPTSNVFVATGDGAVQYHLNELRVAVERGAPIIIVVFNDGRYGANDMMMRGKFGRASWTQFKNPNYVKIAEAYGAAGERIETAGAIRPALERAASSGKPYVIDIPISTEVPFVDNHISGPVFMLDGRDIPKDVSGSLLAGEGGHASK
jgi:acetolactate synthase-1/2/3 large subunit